MTLNGKRVVVLGGTSGIGLATAQAAADDRADLVVVSSGRENVARAVAQLPKGTEGHVVDLSRVDEMRRFFERVGTFDHLVYTAAESLQLTDVASTDLAQARKFWELRFWGAFAAVKYGSSRIRSGGSVVLTTGIAGRRPQAGWSVASSICGAIDSLTRALAVELRPIRVNAVCPGVVRTDLWRTMSAADREAMYANVGESLPVGRVGEATDIAQAYLFLMRDAYSTGQVIVVDGGAVLV